MARPAFLLGENNDEIVGLLGLNTDLHDQISFDTQLDPEQLTGRHLLQSYELDRNLLAYEIHDGMVQYVTGAQMKLQTLLATDDSLQEHTREEITECLTLIQESVEEARNLVRGLRPPMLGELGIISAVQHMINNEFPEETTVDFHYEGQFQDLDPVLGNSIFRIIQESLGNAKKYSHSDKIAVYLTRIDSVIRLEICDWGVGFDTSRVAADRYGLEGMRQRARFLKGTIVIKSDPGKGTRVFVELPITHESGERAPANNGSNE